MRGTSRHDATDKRASDAPIPLAAVSAAQWGALGERAIEPHAYYLPDWELAVNAAASRRTRALALAAFHEAPSPPPSGLMPVVCLWRARPIPLPPLVSAPPPAR